MNPLLVSPVHPASWNRKIIRFRPKVLIWVSSEGWLAPGVPLLGTGFLSSFYVQIEFQRSFLGCLAWFKQTLLGFHITYYSKSVRQCKGGFKTFFHLVTMTGIEPFCYIVMLKSLKSTCFRPKTLIHLGKTCNALRSVFTSISHD